MASARQIAANRRNAELSTGPRTDEGKAISRGNAQTHGLTGDGVVEADDQEAAVNARLEGWRAAHRPANDREEWLVRQAVVQSVRVDACQAAQGAERVRLASRAAATWDDDRGAEAVALGALLSRRPSVVAARLRQSRHGAEWLLGRWKGLEQTLRDGHAWDDALLGMSYDLRGAPSELRFGDPWDGAGSPAALAAREIAGLEARLKGPLAEIDASDRRAAALGMEVPGASGEVVARLRRYEAACWRRLQWAEGRLKQDRPVGPRPDVIPPPASDPRRPLPRSLASERIVPMTDEECLAYEREVLDPLFRSLAAGTQDAFFESQGRAAAYEGPSLTKRTQRQSG